METITVNNVAYSYKAQFDVNLTVHYENDRWNSWHIIREFISNALDGVAGDCSRVKFTKENGFINIADDGLGYSIVYAKRIGASSKKQDGSTIGQFGEGTKLAVLTCLRHGISVRLASQEWLIIPKLITAEEDIQVLAFDIYESQQAIIGSLVSIEATPEIEEVIDNRSHYFLHFGNLSPIWGTMMAGIYSKQGQSRVFNKGVYIKDIDALFSYGLAIEELNRDRDLLAEDTLNQKIRDLWSRVDDPELIKAYFIESEWSGSTGANSQFKEFTSSFYPKSELYDAWIKAFSQLFGGNAVLYTNDLAAKDAAYLGYTLIKLDYYGNHLAQYVGINKDVDVCSDDYEFTWANSLTKTEEKRLEFFRQVADLLGLDCPVTIKVYEGCAKGENVVGVYNPDGDEIFIKRDRLGGDLTLALETFLHELTHRATGADDYSRSFSNGATMLAAKTVLQLSAKVGIQTKLKLTNRGFQLSQSFRFTADNMTGHIATVGDEIVIKVSGYTLRSKLPEAKIRPYSSTRAITYYKGHFYLNIPFTIRSDLPQEMYFFLTVNVEQI